jgi:hypothetical protein
MFYGLIVAGVLIELVHMFSRLSAIGMHVFLQLLY